MATLAQDTFTATSNENLEAHTPDIGSGWTKISGATAVVRASDDRLTNTSEAFYKNGTVPGNADYDVSLDAGEYVGSGWEFRICGRINGASNDRYEGGRETIGGNQWRTISKYVGGARTQLSGTIFPTVATGQTWRLNMVGAAIKLFQAGSQVESVTDSDVTAIGVAGLRGTGVGGGEGWADNFLLEGTAGGGGGVPPKPIFRIFRSGLSGFDFFVAGLAWIIGRRNRLRGGE